jgi:hypothetical protein
MLEVKSSETGDRQQTDPGSKIGIWVDINRESEGRGKLKTSNNQFRSKLEN